MLFLLIMACDQVEVECSEELACDLGAVCMEGVCQEVPCATSEQCNPEQYCEDRQCQDGCLEDSDCYPGDECNTDVRECVEAACRDTKLDCGFGEFCNDASGDCYEASGYYCRSCNDDSDCGSTGDNLCLNFGGGKYCGVLCATDGDCPSGYDCLPVGDFNGNIITYQCATYCWLYEDDDVAAAPKLPPMLYPADMPTVCEGESL